MGFFPSYTKLFGDTVFIYNNTIINYWNYNIRAKNIKTMHNTLQSNENLK